MSVWRVNDGLLIFKGLTRCFDLPIESSHKQGS